MVYATHEDWVDAVREYAAVHAFGISTLKASALTAHMHAHNSFVIAAKADLDAAKLLARPWIDRSPVLPYEPVPTHIEQQIQATAKALRAVENVARKLAKN